jgi:DNA primase
MSIFDTLREQIPLERVIQADGHGKVRCISPEHEDPSPSMHVYDAHVHCFGCQFHGDVTDVWGAIRGIQRPIEAALDLARKFNVKLPKMSDEARQKSEEARQKEGKYLRLARACHAALEKHVSVREWWEDRGFGSELRERFLLGANKDGTEAVIPFWHRGRIDGVIRRKLEGNPKYILPKSEELPEGHKPLFIPGPLQGGVFLLEGYVDALAVAATGKSAIAVGGTAISQAQQEQLSKVLPSGTGLYILPDDDESGEVAAREWGRDLFPAAKVCEASYGQGAKDIADVYARDGVEKTGEHLMRLIATAREMIDIEMQETARLPGPREQLRYATTNIAPLLVRVRPDSVRDATADIVADATRLKKSWLNKLIADEEARLAKEGAERFYASMEEEARRRVEEYRQKVEEAQPEIDSLIGSPGVLGRLRDSAAKLHQVYGDREPLELALLVALGAQLDPLPNGRPLGASILLSAEAGRGKNHIVDAAVEPLPEEFYFSFEIASGQSLYYKADEDPEFLKHTFAYPNEIEGAEALWEFLRPMLSKGWAKKIVTAKDPDGNMTTRTIIVEGPVTIAIPTIRNKTDEQLQTRLLVAELPDYPGRVKHHSAAFSELLLPEAATADYTRERWLWQQGLRQLAAHRRVVFPLAHESFALDDDQISHGARLWANLLSLMATNAWLEQRNRQLLELSSGETAIEATPDDYALAYRVFNAVCKRTVVNLSDTHRKMLDALYDLHQEFPNREGFTQREIKAGANVSQSVVSDNKTFLVMSAKLIKESEHGLSLVEGAEPSWWATGDLMTGLPTPEQVRTWWDDRDPDPDPPPKSADHADRADHANQEGQNPHTYAENGDRHPPDQSPISDRSPAPEGRTADYDRQVIGNPPISENDIGKPNADGDEDVIGMIGKIGGSEGENGKCPHGTPHGHPCDDCEIDRLFGAGVLADNCASCSSAEAGHGKQGELCEECAVAEGAL